MSKTIDEIKEQYAIEKGFNNWEGFIMEQPVYRYEDHTDEVAERYAEIKSRDITKQSDYYIEILDRIDLKNIGIVLGIENNKSVSKNLLPKIKELQEQNADLVEMLIHVVYEYEQGESSYRTIREIKELLTKYNHLNQM